MFDVNWQASSIWVPPFSKMQKTHANALVACVEAPLDLFAVAMEKRTFCAISKNHNIFSTLFIHLFWVVIGNIHPFLGFRRFLVAQHLVVVTNHLDQTRDPHRTPVVRFGDRHFDPKFASNFTLPLAQKVTGDLEVPQYGTSPWWTFFHHQHWRSNSRVVIGVWLAFLDFCLFLFVGPNSRALLRETNGLHSPLIRPAMYWGKRSFGGNVSPEIPMIYFTDSKCYPAWVPYFWVSTKNTGKTPKMDGLYIMENPIKMDDLGGFPPIFGNTHFIPFLANFKIVPSVTFSGRFFRDPWCPCEEIKKNQRMVEK